MIITLTGANDYELKQRLQQLVGNFVAEHGELALERIDAEETDVHTIIEAVQAVPFLAAKKMVVLRGLSANKTAAERIERILDAVADSTDTVIYEPSPDKRTGYYKSLKKRTVLEQHPELDKPSLAKWLAGEAQKRGGSIGLAEATYLVERIGPDQLLLSNELDKLLSLDSLISRDTIDRLTEPSPQSRIFELLDAAFAGQTERTLALYEDQRAQRVEPQRILAMMAWQLHVVALVAASGQRSTGAIAQEAKLNPFVIDKARRIARRLNIEQTKLLVGELLDIDVKSKSTALDLDEALKNYLLQMA